MVKRNSKWGREKIYTKSKILLHLNEFVCHFTLYSFSRILSRLCIFFLDFFCFSFFSHSFNVSWQCVECQTKCLDALDSQNCKKKTKCCNIDWISICRYVCVFVRMLNGCEEVIYKCSKFFCPALYIYFKKKKKKL